jgi:hypothetical protein
MTFTPRELFQKLPAAQTCRLSRRMTGCIDKEAEVAKIKMTAFAWSYWGKPWNTWVRITCLQHKTWTWKRRWSANLPNSIFGTKQPTRSREVRRIDCRQRTLYFRGFTQYFRANFRTVVQNGPRHLLPNPHTQFMTICSPHSNILIHISSSAEAAKSVNVRINL